MTSIIPMSDNGLGETLETADEHADSDGKVDLAVAKNLIRNAWSLGVRSSIDEYDAKAIRMTRDSSAIAAHIERYLKKHATLDIDPNNLSEDTKRVYDALLRDRGLLLFIKRHLELRAISPDCTDDTGDCPQEMYLKRMHALKLLIENGAGADELLEALGAG